MEIQSRELEIMNIINSILGTIDLKAVKILQTGIYHCTYCHSNQALFDCFGGCESFIVTHTDLFFMKYTTWEMRALCFVHKYIIICNI